MKTILEFKKLNDGSIVALSDNLSAVVTDDVQLREYFEKIQEVTGGNCVEWNNTLLAKVKNKIFFSYQPLPADNNTLTAETLKQLYKVCPVFPIIVTDKNACFVPNVQNIIEEIIPCEGDKIFATKAEAIASFKEYITGYIQQKLQVLRHDRDEYFQAGRECSRDINILKGVIGGK